MSSPAAARLLAALRENPLVLAPMAGITDTIFRSLMKELGAGIVISELVSARGMLEPGSGGRKTLELCRFRPGERPVGIQIFGDDPDILGRAAARVEGMGADFVDLNLGCPVPKVVKRGGGAAMLKDPRRLERTLARIRSHISIPLTLKIRSGWDESSINAPECIEAACQAGATWVAIHGRTRSQGYSGRADWELIRRCKEQAGLAVIGNGDILTPEQTRERLAASGCDGVMIGRGALHDPWIFRRARALERGETFEVPTGEFLDLLDRHRDHLEQDGRHRNPSLHLRKFAAWYSHGFPGSAAFRHRIFRARELDEVQDLYREYFSSIRHVPMAARPTEAFLMSGHG